MISPQVAAEGGIHPVVTQFNATHTQYLTRSDIISVTSLPIGVTSESRLLVQISGLNAT